MKMISDKDLDIGINTEVEWGPACRVYIGYWPDWGISYSSEEGKQRLKEISSNSYKEEYSASTGKRMKNISRVSEGSIKRDLPYALNETNADIVSDLVIGAGDEVVIADLGAGNGNTTILTYDFLKDKWKEHGYKEKELRDKVSFILEDPSETLLSEACKRLGKLGLRYRKAPGSVHEDVFEPGSVDIAMSVASLHHYSDPADPHSAVFNSLKPGGYFVDSDWFNSFFRNPLSFRALLENLEWPRE